MIALWILAALLSALAAWLVLRRAAGAVRPGAGEHPERQVHRRQLAEIDELAERGLLAPDETRAARAEAARRLLAAAEDTGPAPADAMRGRWIVAVVAAGAPLVALAIYLATGSPGLPDQPYRERLARWRVAEPGSLAPAEMAALLAEAAKERPRDATPLIYLAQAQAMAGQQARVPITLREAARREPGRADVWIALGQAGVAAAQGQVTPEARAAFARAARLDPVAPAPVYFLGRARIGDGDVAGGLSDWRALLERMPPEAPERRILAAEIAAVARSGRLDAASPDVARAAGASADQRAFIQAMVDRLAARLRVQPDDPAGWARLVRSYGVLGQEERRAAAAAEARRRFAGRPGTLRAILAGDEAGARATVDSSERSGR